MPKTRPPYPEAFRQRMVELVRAGRTPESLGKEFEPSGQTIRNWVRQADRDAGQRTDGVTTPERDELRRLRRENARLREERTILENYLTSALAPVATETREPRMLRRTRGERPSAYWWRDPVENVAQGRLRTCQW